MILHDYLKKYNIYMFPDCYQIYDFSCHLKPKLSLLAWSGSHAVYFKKDPNGLTK